MVRGLSSVFSFVALVALTATTFAQCCETYNCDNGSRIGGRVRGGRVATWRSNRAAARCATPVYTNSAANCGTTVCGTSYAVATNCNNNCVTACNTNCNNGCGTMVAAAPCGSNMTYTNYVPASSNCNGCVTMTSSAPCSSNMTYTNYVSASSNCSGCAAPIAADCTNCCYSNSCSTNCNTNCCNTNCCNDCCNTGRTRSFRVFNRRSSNYCSTGCNTGCSTGCNTGCSTGCNTGCNTGYAIGYNAGYATVVSSSGCNSCGSTPTVSSTVVGETANPPAPTEDNQNR